MFYIDEPKLSKYYLKFLSLLTLTIKNDDICYVHNIYNHYVLLYRNIFIQLYITYQCSCIFRINSNLLVFLPIVCKLLFK